MRICIILIHSIKIMTRFTQAVYLHSCKNSDYREETCRLIKCQRNWCIKYIYFFQPSNHQILSWYHFICFGSTLKQFRGKVRRSLSARRYFFFLFFLRDGFISLIAENIFNFVILLKEFQYCVCIFFAKV